MNCWMFFVTLFFIFNLATSQEFRRCELQVYSEGLQCKCCNINSFLCFNHCCPMGHTCKKGRRGPWCEGPNYSKENTKDWVRADDKDRADFDECDNDEAKRYEYLQSRRLTAFTAARSGM